MIKSQEQQIKDSKNAYVMQVNNTKNNTSQFAVYLDHTAPLSVLWPYEDCHKTKQQLLPYQVYYKGANHSIPAFHFKVSGYQFNHFNNIKRMLRKINPDIGVYILNGWSPSNF